MQNKEFLGKSDPYFCIEYGDFQETSVTLNNVEKEVVWNDVNMFIEVDKRCLNKEKLKITVFDENVTRADIPLGFGIASVTQLCRSVLTERKIKVDLSDEKGALCGTIFLNAMLVPSKVEVRTQSEIPFLKVRD